MHTYYIIKYGNVCIVSVGGIKVQVIIHNLICICIIVLVIFALAALIYIVTLEFN